MSQKTEPGGFKLALISGVIAVVSILLTYTLFLQPVTTPSPLKAKFAKLQNMCSAGIGDLPPQIPRDPEIEELEGIENIPSKHEFYAKYIRTNRPVVIRGGVDDWPALQLWTDEYLAAVEGATPVNVEHSLSNDFGDMQNEEGKKKGWGFQYMSLQKFLNIYLADPASLTQADIEEDIILPARTNQKKYQFEDVQDYGTDTKSSPIAVSSSSHFYLDTFFPAKLSHDVSVPDFIPCLRRKEAPYWRWTNLWMGGGREVWTEREQTTSLSFCVLCFFVLFLMELFWILSLCISPFFADRHLYCVCACRYAALRADFLVAQRFTRQCGQRGCRI